jgi:peptidoglycan/xylan/chitin deacetylase (PgdA/CDA1 family)
MKKRAVGIIISALLLTAAAGQVYSGRANLLEIAGQKEGTGNLPAGKIGNAKKVYLTFDDGPSDHTGEILDILKKNKVKATFFVIGKKTETAKKLYRRIILEGHTLGMHSYSHDYDRIYSSVDAFGKDLWALSDYLYDITEVRPCIYRFPGGSSNRCAGNIRPFIRYVNRQGWMYYDWNALNGDALDFEVSSKVLNQRILKDIRKQKTSIVLMHDLHETEHTVEGLDELIKTLKKEGCKILPITKNTKPVHHVSVDK